MCNSITRQTAAGVAVTTLIATGSCLATIYPAQKYPIAVATLAILTLGSLGSIIIKTNQRTDNFKPNDAFKLFDFWKLFKDPQDYSLDFSSRPPPPVPPSGGAVAIICSQSKTPAQRLILITETVTLLKKACEKVKFCVAPIFQKILQFL